MNILFVSLGCDKNLVDTEVMLGLLASRGHQMVDSEEIADVIVINTCCFIHDAKEESIQTILEMAEYKKAGSCKALIVTGCLAQRYKQEIIDEIEEVDAVLGTTSYDKIVEAIDEALAGHTSVEMTDIDALPLVESKRLVTTGGHFAYLKIAEGCDKHCTYCIIPKIRGNFRSVPIERLLKEAEDLVAQGVKEIILVAQETTLYGKDLYGEKSLHKLLRELCKISGLRWIRILYCYPEEITDELIQVIKEEDKICNYLDLPIQHASDGILKRMGRRTSKEQLVEIIGKLRKEIPDIAIRTTLITGFPGETQEQHEELMEFVDEMEFDRLGVFTYSPEEDTPAAVMPDQIPEDVKEDRQAELMELQQEIAFDLAEEMIGREVLVMIEGKVADENAYVGRTYKDAPNVDGLIFVESEEELMSGDFARVRITGALEYDLMGDYIMNLPNKLTVLRVLMILFFVVFMITPLAEGNGKYIALALFCIASLTDMLDGKIARKHNLVTNFGKFMDPLADKLLVCSAMICLIETGKLQAWIVLIIIAREFIISGFRLVASDNGIVIAASYWGKFKTVSHMAMIILLILDIQNPIMQTITTVVVWIGLILTVVSLVDYIVKNKQVLTQGGM